MKPKKPKLYPISYTLYPVLAACLLAFAAGCETADSKTALADRFNSLKLEKAELTRQLQQAETENKQLKKQLQVISGLPADKLENLYHLQKVKIHRYTNLYDKDKDGQYEKLIVYIQPIDKTGDIVKATGAVDVQLWNLNSPQANQTLLGQWHIKPDELKKLWFATIVTINYRLTFDVADKIAGLEEPLTLKVTFTDYLTGRVFKEQKVIKP